MRLDQLGLPAGVAGFARTDGLDTGARVTLTSVGGGSTHRFQLLWVPPDDLTAIPTLAPASPTSYEFDPQAGTWGTYRVELIVDEGLPTEDRQIRIFGVRLPNGILIPAANETASPAASRVNAGADQIAQSENNEPFAPFLAGSPWGWWPWVRDVSAGIGSGGGGGAGIRFRIPAPVSVVVQPTFQYLVQGPLIIDPGASLVVDPGAQLVVL